MVKYMKCLFIIAVMLLSMESEAAILKWLPPCQTTWEQPVVRGYNVYRRENRWFQPWKPWKDVGSVTSVEIPNEKGYCYRNTSYNQAGESKPSKRVCH